MSPASQARAAAKAANLSVEMDLAELRQVRQLSQQKLGRSLKVGQAAIAKMEKRADVYVSTLRRVIEAMGGQLRIVARFQGHDINITNFSRLSRPSKSASGADSD
jgi:predicted transcriptional regulator